MASEKQIQANQINAKLGGPKTEAGKNLTRSNARKHGILALLQTDYEKGVRKDVLDALYGELGPVGFIEELLVERIATYYLKMYRLARAEAEFVESSTSKINSIFSIGEPTLKPEAVDSLVLTYSRYETSLENKLYRALRELEHLQAIRSGRSDSANWDCLAK